MIIFIVKMNVFIFLALLIPVSSLSQPTIKTATPCDDELLFKIPG